MKIVNDDYGSSDYYNVYNPFSEFNIPKLAFKIYLTLKDPEENDKFMRLLCISENKT